MSDFASLEPLEGGRTGETFAAVVPGGRQVVRIHARNPARAEVDAALLRLVRGLVPVAEVLEVRPARGEMPALLVTSYLPGVRADLLLPDLDDDGLATVGRHVGDLVATLAGIPLLRPGGFVGAGLHVEPWDLPDGLPGRVEAHLPALSHWTFEDKAALRSMAEDAQDLLDTVGRTCLVHGDLDPENLLLDPATLEVTGLVDWEHAHAGHPFTDLGHALRLERPPAYADAVLAAYAHGRGTPATEARSLGRAADLGALVDLDSRRDADPVARRTHDLLLAAVRGVRT